MRNRIVTAVKQRFSIRKLSIGAASVLLGTSLYFMGGSATIVHADTNVSGTETSKAAVQVEPASAGVQQKAPTNDKIDKNELDSIARNNDNNDTAVNDAIDKYAQVKQKEVGDNALIRASDKEPTTIADTASQRGDQVDSIADKLDTEVNDANQEAKEINDYKNAHPNTVSGKDMKDFADQGLSIDDEKDSEINQITVDHNNKDNTLPIGQSETIDGIYITHTDNMTHKEQNVMKINSKNKVIVDFQQNQCSGKEITVTYNNLKNSYYLENIDNKTNKIKITKIERTFSDIQPADTTRFTSDGHTPKGADGVYDKCYGPQLIIYNDPYDGFFYNNIKQVSVKDIYYDDNKAIAFTNGDNNKAWIFVSSLNSNGGGNVEKVKAENPDGTPADVEKIAGSTVTGLTTKDFTRTVELYDEHSNGDYLRNYLRTNAENLKNQGWIWQENSPELTQTVTLHVKKTNDGYVYDNADAFFKGLTLHPISENGTEKYPDIEIPEVRVGSKTAVRIRISYSANNSHTPKPLDETEVDADEEKATDTHDGWWYSDESNSPQNNYPDWDNKSKDNIYAFVGAVAIQYQPGMTITYGADDTEWGSHWACMQTQVVSSLNQHFVNRQGTVTRTIHYLYDNGNTAQPDKTQTVSFNETGIKDDVTGKTTWSNDNAQTVDSVITPSITGYTPDQSSIEKHTFNFGDPDINVTVHYNANAQTAKITYIDDTTKTNLDSKDANGKFGQTITFTTAPTDEIASYEKQGYVLVSNSFNNNKYQADNSNNVFYVHLKHGTHAIKESTSPKQTIHYVYADGLARQGQAADDNIQTLRFERNGYNDEVTGTDHWNAWTPTNSNYNAVDSPVIQGYTPDKSVIEKSTVNPTDKDIEITVTYNADKQAAHVIYVDKTTGKTLETTDLTGVSDQNSGYNTQKQIGDYRNKHYVLTSDETNGKNIVFDHNDKADQTYYVYFVHGTQDVNRQDDVTETVDYKFEDGTTAQPTVTQTKHFSEDGVKDLVTGEITWTPATPQKFDDIATKSIVGYTPDKDNVAGSTVNFCDPDINVTVYYKANAQKASVTYVDDKTGKTLKVDNLNGVTNAKSGYTTKAAIDTYTGLGYTLVSDDTNGKEVVFDNDDAVDQAFTVHLSHGTITVTPENPGKPGEPVDPDNPDGPKYLDGTDEYQVKRTGTQTIHYVGASDKTPADNKQTFVFTREITFDDVTGKIISVTPWNVQSHTFGNVDTPVIPGYHADKAVAGGATVTPDDLNKVIIVTYAPDGGSGDNPGSNGGGDQGTTPTPEPVPEPTPSPDDQPDTTLPSDNNTDKDVEKDKQDKPEEVKKVRKIIKTRITKQKHIGNAEKAEPLAEQEHNDQTVASPVKNEANEPQLPQTGEANTSVIGLLGMLVAGFAAILGFESSRSRKHKN